MANKIKNEFVAYSEPAIRNNLSIVEYCRTSVAAVSGCTAGVLGLTGLYGALFFVIAVTSFWFMLLFKAGIDSWKKYFISRKSLLLNGHNSNIKKREMADERNFRSAYYEKVGFRSVEEKKSLEILLKEKPLDRGKLKQFCLRFSVPTIYRNLIWKLLLGVIPVHIDSHNFIMDQRKQEYHDLNRALTVIRVIDSNTPKQQIVLAMWLLQSGNYTIDTNLITERGFTNIVQSFMQFFEDDADIFWLSRNFYENVKKFESEIGKLIEKTHILLEREDPVYYKHLSRCGILDNLPLAKWFDCCFAGILNKTALERIWDKLCGGSYKILVFVAVILLTTLKPRISKCLNISGVVQYIKNITEETADVIANKSIEMWQQHGSPLTIHDKPKP